MVMGRVHSVESFGTVDGPGIRYVVFLQGCPLRCRYCHNRDTWSPSGGKEMEAKEVLRELESYKDFMIPSGGGVTLTGGEPTLQPEFVKEIFKGAKALGLNTALDTSGFTCYTNLEEVMEFTDLILLDIKHMDSQKHRWLTGVSNKAILDFAREASKRGKPLWIRYTLVPGINDSLEDLEPLARLLGQLESVEKVEFLPYHTLGLYKWSELGHEYPLKGIPPATEEDIKRAEQLTRKLHPNNSSEQFPELRRKSKAI